MVALRRRWRNSESCTITTDWDVSKLSQALTLRTQAYDVVHKRFGFITEFLSMGADEIEKVAQNLQQCYPNNLQAIILVHTYMKALNEGKVYNTV